jgi:HEAT repeat protein
MTNAATAERIGLTSAEFRAQTATVINRQREAAEIAGFILDAGVRLVVLHGALDSGKTELVTRWVIPELRTLLHGTGRDVLYGECDPAFPDRLVGGAGAVAFEDALRRRDVLIVDSFDLLLELPRDTQRAQLDRLFARLLSPGVAAILVVVTTSRHLNSVYALASYHPDATKAVRELRSMSVEETLIRLGRTDDEERIDYEPAMLQAVTADCAELAGAGFADNFDLVRLVHARAVLRHREAGRRSISLLDYEEMGRAPGILRAYLEHALDVIESDHRGDGLSAHLVLERLYEFDKDRTPVDFDRLAARLGIPRAELDRIIGRMSGPDGILRLKADKTLRVVPRQLIIVVGEDLADRRRQLDRVRRVVTEGTREWLQTGALLSAIRFREVHEGRCSLTVTDEQARFLVHCALLQEDETLAGAARYWLGRVEDPADRVNLLLLSLLQGGRHSRLHAADLLGGYATPEVRDRLCSVALTDPEPDVRAKAVDSLAQMKTDEVLGRILHEVKVPESQYRAAAINALRIFPSPDIAAVLKRQVNDASVEPALREEAIAVLSALEIPEAVDALLDIALHDDDDVDRQAAAQALGSFQKDELNQRIFDALGSDPRPRRWLAGGALGVVALVVFLVAVSRWEAADAETSVWVDSALSLVALLVTAPALRKLRRAEISLGSASGVAAATAFLLNAYTTFPVVHGLAHLAAGLRRRAALIFGVELLGAAFMLMVAPTFEASTTLGWAGEIFRYAGVILLVATYVYDVVGVLLGSVVLNRATMLDVRRTRVYERVFANAAAAKLIVESVERPPVIALPFAVRLLRRFGDRMQPAQLVALLEASAPRALPYVSRALQRNKTYDTVQRLEELWKEDESPSVRRRIARILYREPNECALEALDRLRPQMGRLQRLRARLATHVYAINLWPRAARIAFVALLPALGVWLYNGVMMIRNPAWSQIVALHQDKKSRADKAKIVKFLADAYPVESARQLYELFAEDRDQLGDSLHAETALALAKLDTLRPAEDAEWRNAVTMGVAAYDSLLTRDTSLFRRDSIIGVPDTAAIGRALDVMTSFARGRDTALARRAAHGLTGYARAVLARERGRGPIRRRALRAIGGMHYKQAFPILNGLFTEQEARSKGENFRDDIRDERNRLVRTYAAGLDVGSLRAQKALLGDLRTLTDGPAGLKEDLERRVACDRNGDDTCDEIENALQNVAQHPAAEYGYRELLEHYMERRDTLGGARALDSLRRAFPAHVWPRKLLSEAYHEFLAPSQATYFTKSYDEMRALRLLPEYQTMRQAAAADFERIESDYMEVALSAREYDEADRVARRLLATTTDSTEWLNSLLFAYMAMALKGDTAAAIAGLADLAAFARDVPPGFVNNWRYPGTIAFLKASPAPAPLKEALLKLCRGDRWFTREEAAAIIAENRRALSVHAGG